MPRKILIVEDETTLLEAYRAALADSGIEIVGAATVIEAMRVVENDGPFDAIAVDGCFPYDVGGEPYPERGRACNGEKLVGWLRGRRVGYAGPILACSSMPELNDKMVQCGATSGPGKGRALCDAIKALFPPTPAG